MGPRLTSLCRVQVGPMLIGDYYDVGAQINYGLLSLAMDPHDRPARY
jgi:hypothetical protein